MGAGQKRGGLRSESLLCASYRIHSDSADGPTKWGRVRPCSERTCPYLPLPTTCILTLVTLPSLSFFSQFPNLNRVFVSFICTPGSRPCSCVSTLSCIDSSSSSRRVKCSSSKAGFTVVSGRHSCHQLAVARICSQSQANHVL